MKRYDLCVIGGGPAGYAAAMRALDLGKKVLLVEKNKIGGAGLYNGALSSKTFWEISMEIFNLRRRLQKYSGGEIKIEFKEILNDVHEAIFLRKIQLETHLLLLQRKKKYLLEYVKAEARLANNHEVVLKYPDGKEETIYADFLVLATGSRPRKLPNIEIDEKHIVTSDGIEDFTEFPKSMVILGAGVIGCEWATIFSNFGETDVKIIDKANRILPFEDEDVSFMVESFFEDHGVHVHKNSKVERMEVKNGMVEYELLYNDGTREIHTVEKALVAVGRVPNTENLGLENLGIKFKERGTIEDYDTKTSVSNIYVAGDITSDVALVSIAELEARHAVEKMFGINTKELTYTNISSIMFLNPETAGVGMNELQAKKKGICYKVVSIDFSLIPRAIAMRNTKGFFKILVTNDDEMRILGMRAVGEHASTAIQAVALLISMDRGIEDLAELIHPHPSIIEGIQECVRMLKGKSILKPEIFKDTLRCKGCNEMGEYYDLYQIS